jgi:hypothetical protein
MKLSFLRRRSVWLSIIALVVLSAFLGFSTLTKAHADAKTLEGTWTVQIQFTSGPMAGQTKTANVVYNQDGTLTSETTDGVAGTGTWTMTSKLGFNYVIDEQVYNNGRNIGYIHVVQDGQLSENAKTNTASGSGTFYIYTPHGPVPTSVNDAQTSAVRTAKGNGN